MPFAEKHRKQRSSVNLKTDNVPKIKIAFELFIYNGNEKIAMF